MFLWHPAKKLPATAQTFFTKKGTFLSSESEQTHGSVIKLISKRILEFAVQVLEFPVQEILEVAAQEILEFGILDPRPVVTSPDLP